jgi:hypothetical protein
MVHDLLRPDHRRQRQTSPQPLAEDNEVRLQSLMLETVQFAASCEAHFDFVDDDPDAVAAN